MRVISGGVGAAQDLAIHLPRLASVALWVSFSESETDEFLQTAVEPNGSDD